jgi:hypothetical protein
MIFWSKEDSNNLASIARSLEKLTERELERNLAMRFVPEINSVGFKERMQTLIRNKEKITVSESPSLEDEALEEAIQRGQKMQAKVTEAHRTGNVPFVVEDLFDAEELENL